LGEVKKLDCGEKRTSCVWESNWGDASKKLPVPSSNATEIFKKERESLAKKKAGGVGEGIKGTGKGFGGGNFRPK